MSCAAGDAIHNLRSALDVIVDAVARLSKCGADELKQVQFVVRPSGKSFEDAVKKGKSYPIDGAWIKNALGIIGRTSDGMDFGGLQC